MDLCVEGAEQARVYKNEHQEVVLSYNEDDNDAKALESPMKSSLNQSQLTDPSISVKFDKDAA